MWQPSASILALKQRAALMRTIRKFFDIRNYLEVETPIMGKYGITDVYLSNLTTEFRQEKFALQTSPEYHMKRLLAAGSGSIFQIAKVFRDDEWGRWHNPEFTLLEWYKLDVDHHQLMVEVDEFLQEIINSPPLIKKTYQQAFIEACDLDPFSSSVVDLRKVLKRYQLDQVLSLDEKDRDQYLFLFMASVVEPYLSKLNCPVAIYDFPESQAALAKIENGKAQRFEIYYQGIELANGFHELTDPSLQEARLQHDLYLRAAKGFSTPPIDSRFIAALHAGMPSCSGVALGVDRLIALALKTESLSQVLAFDIVQA